MSREKTIAVLCCATLVGLIVVAQRWRSNEKIINIHVHGADALTEKEILDSAHVALGSRMADVDLRDLRLHLRQSPYVSNVVISRSENAVDIAVTERLPIARVSANGAMCLFDSAGNMFPCRTGVPLDVPIVYGLTKSVNGLEMIDTPGVIRTAALMRQIQSYSRGILEEVSAIRCTPSGDYVFETNGSAVPVRFGTATDVEEKAIALKSFMPLLERRGEQQAEYVDVRFHDQVVVRWKDSIGDR